MAICVIKNVIEPNTPSNDGVFNVSKSNTTAKPVPNSVNIICTNSIIFLIIFLFPRNYLLLYYKFLAIQII